MKNLFQALVITTTALLLIIVGTFVYFQTFVNNGLHYEPIVIEEGLVLTPGDEFIVHLSRCADRTYEVDVRSSLIRKVESGNEQGIVDEETFLVGIHATADKGCREFVGVERVLPITTLPGEYILRNVITYKIRWFLFEKTRDITIESNTFIVRGVRIGDEAYIK